MDSITWVMRTLIVPVAIVAAAREIGAALTPAGAGMFTAACCPDSPDYVGNATAYISSGLLDGQFAALLDDPAALYAAAQAGAQAQGIALTATEADCVTLLSTGDISEDPPFIALARLNLRLVPPDDPL